MTEQSPPKAIHDLIAIMAALRTPGTGCPWDLEQSFESIAPYTIEEAYEVADAIEHKDMEGLKEELGDLLLQVVYHARLAEEAGLFDFADVVDAISTKMVRRHPHVFGNDEERANVELDGLWERVKAEEKAERSGGGGVPPKSVLDGVPVALPAMTRAVKLQNKAAKVGFDWPGLGPVFAKAREELGELEAVIATAHSNESRRNAIIEEYGDFAFVIANVARHLGIDPETAVRATNAKFVRRFARVEALLAAEGRSPEQSDLEEMDSLWDQAKAEER